MKVPFTKGTQVPANVAAVPFTSDSVRDAGAIRLFDSTNTEIPTTIQDDPAGFPTEPVFVSRKLLVPTSPLAEGKNSHLKFASDCDAEGKEVEWGLDVGPSQSLIAIGTLSGEAAVGTKLVDPKDAHYDCGVHTPDVIEVGNSNAADTVEAVAIDLRLKPTPELQAFAPVTGFIISVDGQERQRTAYGEAQASGDGLIVGRLRASCDPSAATLGEATAGTHTVGVRAHVAGTTSDPPEVTTTLTFSCGGESSGSPDGGAASSPDASTPGTNDASTPGTNDASTRGADGASSDDSGCAVGRDSSNAWGQIGAFFAGLALVVSSRSLLRRRSRSR